ncbi:hypothetical protein [Micromonospora sp. DT233]|uniref:hypothetical protein n=1 Tax=Micromonospora sp. DT233 TaxID=3393432 RepID=UPI003CFA29AF
MLLKSIAIAASVAGVLVTAPAASAATTSHTPDWRYWGPGNCTPGYLCGWPSTEHPEGGPTETPTLKTNTDWTGNVMVYQYYNYTSRKAKVSWNHLDRWSGTVCVTPGENWFYIPFTVSKVVWEDCDPR